MSAGAAGSDPLESAVDAVVLPDVDRITATVVNADATTSSRTATMIHPGRIERRFAGCGAAGDASDDPQWVQKLPS